MRREVGTMGEEEFADPAELINMQVFTGEPGLEHRETLKTASHAAAAAPAASPRTMAARSSSQRSGGLRRKKVRYEPMSFSLHHAVRASA
jgi:hypothetical protein